MVFIFDHGEEHMVKKQLKVDLHVHSKFSVRPSEWILQKLGCSESYTEPKNLYEIARARGMDHVTITDHNTLAGSLEIAHLKNSFISEEITAYFPEDRCKVHVLAWNITEGNHNDISRYRENIYELVEYLNRQNITHALAHPTFALNDRLSFEHFEELLLLFNVFEMNGTRDNYQNNALKNVLKNITKERIEEFGNRYGIKSYGNRPWIKSVIGGSDDHSSLNIARTYTEVDDVSSLQEFFMGIRNNRSGVKGEESTPKTMARNLYSIAYQFYNNRFSIDRYSNDEALLRFAERILTNKGEDGDTLYNRLRGYIGYRRPNYFYKTKATSLKDMLLKEAREIINEDTNMNIVVSGTGKTQETMDDIWFKFVNRISEKVFKDSADSVLKNVPGANLFDIFNTIGSAGSLYTMLAPYFLSYGLFTKDRKFCRNYLKRFYAKENPSNGEHLRVAHFTDTFHEVNGVARTLRMQVEVAKKYKKNLTMITCGPEIDRPGLIAFKPIGDFEMPEYPKLRLYYPPLLSMLDYCYKQRFTHIHSATPGPIGLAALAIAKILKLPLYGTYHTSLPQYADQLTEDPAMGELMWKYVAWYYNQMDMVLVSSHATGDELAANGIKKEKIKLYLRGIDVDRFHPAKRNGFYRSRYNVDDKTFKLLYVGRVSKEKNLHFLVDIYRKLVEQDGKFHFIVIGEGPYVKEMGQELKNYQVTFTGYLRGEDLSQAYASSDLFVFPSITDTFGNVVLEAQASGLPVLVTDQGGPKENIVHEQTGYIISANNPEGFVSRILDISSDEILRDKMRRNARTYVEGRSFESAYLDNWRYYHEVKN
jgi:glycosyltransferase involved in cell wall biosynthesis